MSLRRKLMRCLRRPVTWGAVFLSYAGIIAAVAYGGQIGVSADANLRREAHVREQQICQVIINVNNNAKFRAGTEQRRVEATVDYLADPDVKRDALYRRISEMLPATRADRDVAKDNVRATTPPPICMKYARR